MSDTGSLEACAPETGRHKPLYTHLLFYGGLREACGRARVGGDGQLSRLPADALARVACSLPAASVLSLGGVRGWEVSSHM